MPLGCSLYKTSWSMQGQVQTLCQCGPSIFGSNFEDGGAGELVVPHLWKHTSSSHQKSCCPLGNFHMGRTLYGTHCRIPFLQSQEPWLHLCNSLLLTQSPSLPSEEHSYSVSPFPPQNSGKVGQQVPSSFYVGPGSTKGITNSQEKSESQNHLG